MSKVVFVQVGLDPLHLGEREQENVSHGGTSAMG
jgi:hypothetical protein